MSARCPEGEGASAPQSAEAAWSVGPCLGETITSVEVFAELLLTEANVEVVLGADCRGPEPRPDLLHGPAGPPGGGTDPRRGLRGVPRKKYRVGPSQGQGVSSTSPAMPRILDKF